MVSSDHRRAGFIRDSKPEDQLFIVHFSDDARLGLPQDRPFSASVAELRTALMKATVGGHTALYNGIALALDQFQKASPMKKLLLIVSDDGDNRNRNRLNDIIKRVDRVGALMYMIGLSDENTEDKESGCAQTARSSTRWSGILAARSHARTRHLLAD
jgi:Mg-chelatase subunit ChlD